MECARSTSDVKDKRGGISSIQSVALVRVGTMQGGGGLDGVHTCQE